MNKPDNIIQYIFHNLLLGYVKMVRNLCEDFYTPLVVFVKSYSKSIGESLKVIFQVVTNIIIISPILLLSLATGVLINGQLPSFNEITQITFSANALSVIMFFTGVTGFIILYTVYNESLKSSLFFGLINLIGAYLLLQFSTPDAYVVALTVFYGIGGYIVSKIELKNRHPQEHIYEDVVPHYKILYYTLLFAIPIVAVNAILYLEVLSDFIMITTIVAVGLAYSLTYIQAEHYRAIYQHAELKAGSEIWILTPRLLLVLTGGLALLNSTYNLIIMFGFLSSIIFPILFILYFELQVSNESFGHEFRDANNYGQQLTVRPYEDLSIDTEFSNAKSIANLDFNLDLDINKNTPNDIAVWHEYGLILHGLNKSINEMSGVGDEKKKEFNTLYDSVCYNIYQQTEKSDEEIPWNNWPDELTYRIRSQMRKDEDVNLKHISDIEIRDNHSMEKDPSEFTQNEF